MAIISDVHGNSWALQAVLADIKRRGIQNIVNLGDCLYGPLDPAGTAQMLMELNIPTVRGNEDRIVVDVVETSTESKPSPTLCYVRECLQPRHLEWLKTLTLTTGVNEDFFLCHGSPTRDDEYLLVEVLENGVFLRSTEKLMNMLSSYRQRVFLCGHDHVPRTVSLPEKFLVSGQFFNYSRASIKLSFLTRKDSGPSVKFTRPLLKLSYLTGKNSRPPVKLSRENGKPSGQARMALI